MCNHHVDLGPRFRFSIYVLTSATAGVKIIQSYEGSLFKFSAFFIDKSSVGAQRDRSRMPATGSESQVCQLQMRDWSMSASVRAGSSRRPPCVRIRVQYWYI